MLKKYWVILSLSVLLCFSPSSVSAETGKQFYPLSNIVITDGDTIKASLDLGFDVSMHSRIRIIGYDAPETWRPKSAEEKALGLLAKAYLAELLLVPGAVLVPADDWEDSFGRLLGDIRLADGRYVSDIMIANGHIK